MLYFFELSDTTNYDRCDLCISICKYVMTNTDRRDLCIWNGNPEFLAL